MLVIISDIHLTDGSSGATVHQGTFRVFRDRLRDLAYAASWRTDRKYRPIKEMDIVLLGDTLDVLRSSKWLEAEKSGHRPTLRPWCDSRRADFTHKVQAITSAILKENRVFFEMMRELHDTTIVSAQAATRNGSAPRQNEARQDSGQVPIKLRIHYMVGNHDWFYHLSLPAYRAVRRDIVGALGLENDPANPFPHDPSEPAARTLQQIFDEHRVLARHGDIYDPLNFEGDRDASSLGDAIVIDLVTSFALEVKSKLGDSLPPECLAGLNEIDNVRPVLMVPVWVGGLMRRTCRDVRLHGQVQEAWNDLVQVFLRIPFVQERLSARWASKSTQRLKWALTLSKALLRPESRRTICWIGEKIGPRERSYSPYAVREACFKSGRARFIVYGHTHRHEMVPLDSSFSAGGPVNQIYLNSGTWRPVHELARYKRSREAFVGYHAMTYLAFFKDDERGGRTFESWSGNLAQAMPAH